MKFELYNLSKYLKSHEVSVNAQKVFKKGMKFDCVTIEKILQFSHFIGCFCHLLEVFLEGYKVL